MTGQVLPHWRCIQSLLHLEWWRMIEVHLILNWSLRGRTSQERVEAFTHYRFYYILVVLSILKDPLVLRWGKEVLVGEVSA